MKKNLFTAFLLFIVISSAVQLVHAQSASLPLTVFPAIQDKQVKPGERTRLLIQFKNGGDEAVVGSIKVVNFTIVDKAGGPRLLEDPKMKSKYGAASWVTPAMDKIAIPGRDYVSVDLTVQVPDKVDTCGAYAIVYFEPNIANLSGVNSPEEKKSGSLISARLGGILNFRIENQQCRERLNLSNLKAPSFLEYGPIPLSFDIVNLGNFDISPKGLVIVTNMLGQVVDQQSLKDQRIFPESATEYQITSGSKFMFGKFRVAVNASTGGPKNPAASDYIEIVVFPWKICAIIILAMVIAYLFFKYSFGKAQEKTVQLEGEVEKEKEEIEKLKKELKNRE